RASAEPKGSSGQYYIRQIVRLLDHLRADGWQVRLQWLPGHEGVYGNERADRLAKDAAEGDGELAGPVLYASLRRRTGTGSGPIMLMAQPYGESLRPQAALCSSSMWA
ncbi:hypothetical protein GB937_010925, partial [Aspergillus fischeri]